MKQLTCLFFLLMTLGISLSGCHRNYKVIHVRPAEDTTIVHETPEPEETRMMEDEPLLEIPAPPKEEDFTNVSSSTRKEFDDYIHGR